MEMLLDAGDVGSHLQSRLIIIARTRAQIDCEKVKPVFPKKDWGIQRKIVLR